MVLPDESSDLELPLTDPRHPLNRDAVASQSENERTILAALRGEPKALPAPSKKFFIVGGTITNDPIAMVMYRVGWGSVNDYTHADAIIFPGGADISPSLYKDEMHPTTKINAKMDAQWKAIYGHIRSAKWLKIGICRGAQFLNVMNGGRLWQNVDRHGRNHEAIYCAKNGQKLVFDVTSTHHQMMQRGNWAEMWVYAKEATFRDEGKDRNKLASADFDPEVVYYSNTRTLCFQPHPEYGLASCERLFELCLKRAVSRSSFFVEPQERTAN